MFRRLFDLIFGCPHRRWSRPMADRKTRLPYMVCLECGTERWYDWLNMRMGARK